ncbi:MAG: DNA polymerase III subunit gamma/tau [Campylobacterota bacterium]|nr:DNA polymerase III subunit gamma/tau [Campylobacterota bacterium]
MQSQTTRQVLALKYRPKRFEDLIGQETISTTLSLALDTNRLSHAYLLSGLRGSGKTSTARIMAKALVCQNAPTSKPCEECIGCKNANENRHLDIIEMDAASNRGIDDIKDLIEHTKYKPTSAKYKVFIIDEVHMLTTQAFNALLKTLEEPPDFVKFILATTDPLKLPATILSRTQHFRFRRISDSNIIHHLTHILNIENIQFESSALQMLTRSGQGSLRDTLTLLDQAIIYSKGIISTATVTDMLGMIDPVFLDNMFDIILSKGDIRNLVDSLESYEVGQVLDEISIYLKEKMLLNDSRFELYLFDRFFRVIADGKQLLNLNSDGGFVLILTLSKLIEAVNLKTIEELTQDIQNKQAEKTINSSVKTVTNDTKVIDTVQKDIAKVENNNEQKVISENEKLFLKVIANIYDKDYALGECFEKSFTFSSYENNILKINSTASGDCKTLLFKNFSHIKLFIENVFGEDTELDFDKIKKEPKKEMARTIQPTIEANFNTKKQSLDDNTSVGSMIEDIELNQTSSCVSTLSSVSNPTLSQVELNINDVLNSKFMNSALQLFQSPNPPRIKSKL